MASVRMVSTASWRSTRSAVRVIGWTRLRGMVLGLGADSSGTS
jgi:hypothetical protein